MKCFINLLIFIISFNLAYSQGKAIKLSHYIFPEFTEGLVLMKGGSKYDASLNYNSLSQEMIFENKSNGKKLAIAGEELEKVDTIFIRDKKFCTLNHKFVELVYHSTCDLYAEHFCRVTPPGKPSGYGGTSQTAAISSISSLYAEGKYYELDLPGDFKVEPYTYYWLKRKGEVKKFTNLNQLMKLYDDRKDACKAYVKKYDVKYTNQESIVHLLVYLESIGSK